MSEERVYGNLKQSVQNLIYHIEHNTTEAGEDKVLEDVIKEVQSVLYELQRSCPSDTAYWGILNSILIVVENADETVPASHLLEVARVQLLTVNSGLGGF